MPEQTRNPEGAPWLDLSLDETSVCIVSEDGVHVTEDTLARDLAALADYLQATGCRFAGMVGSLCTIAIVNAGCAQYPVSGAEF